MPRKPTDQDFKIFATLADHSVLTIQQLSLAIGRNPKSLARRVRELGRLGLIQTIPRPLGRKRGRPENVLLLTASGADLLLDQLDDSHDLSVDTLAGSPTGDIDHTLLINWVRIGLQGITDRVSSLNAVFLASNSPFLPQLPDGSSPVLDRVVVDPTADKWMDFIPDGVFTINNGDPGHGKSLLFFLEVDMGTEPLASPTAGGRDLRQKILSYQAYFRTNRYKRYEELWGCRFNGFRLLFLANTVGRMTAICRLVQEMVPSDFIWVTDQGRVFEKGLGAAIWARGGKDQTSPHSILGPSLAYESPEPPRFYRRLICLSQATMAWAS